MIAFKIRVSRAKRRKWQATWRERHPICACWHDHKHNAKKRGIPVEWTYEEFRLWCLLTGYHILRKDGFQIHRRNDFGPYAFHRCECIPATENRRLQEVEKKKAKWREFRKNMLARNGFVGLYSNHANFGVSKQKPK